MSTLTFQRLIAVNCTKRLTFWDWIFSPDQGANVLVYTCSGYQGLVPRLYHCMYSLHVNTLFDHLMTRHQLKQLVSKLSVESLFFFISRCHTTTFSKDKYQNVMALSTLNTRVTNKKKISQKVQTLECMLLYTSKDMYTHIL